MKTTFITTALILKMVSVTEAHKGVIGHNLPEIQIQTEISDPNPPTPREMEAATDSVFSAVMVRLSENSMKQKRPPFSEAFLRFKESLGL